MPDSPLSPDVVKLDGPFEHEYIHTRGLRLHAAVAGADGAPLIVLLHDAHGGWFDYAACLAPIAEAGFRAVAVDLRGYGLSDKPPVTSNFSVRTHVSDIAGLIPALGYDRAVVVGCDTGGSVAWTLATSHPERVAALVSIASAHPVDLRRSVFARPWEFMWLLARHLAFRLPSAMLTRSPRRLAAAAGKFLRLNTATRYHRSGEFQEEEALRRKALQIGSVQSTQVHTTRILLAPTPLRFMNDEISAPTLLLHAKQSLWRGVNARSVRRIKDGVVWKETSVPGAKNLPHVETPAAFVDTLSEFLRCL